MKYLNKEFSKIVLLISIVSVSISCSSIDTSKIAPGYKETYVAMKNAIIGFPESNISVDVINNIPYASMLIQIGKGPTGLVILESKLGEEYTWLSADQIYLVVHNGKIIESSGFQNNLIYTFQSPIPFQDIINGKINDLKGYYSYDNPPLKNLAIDFEYKVIGKEEVDILNTTKILIKVEERGHSYKLGWKFVNEYWIDQDLVVWKSKQFLSPKLPVIKYTLTKKPSL